MVTVKEVQDHLRLIRAFHRMFSGIHEWVEFETTCRVRFIHTLLIDEMEALEGDGIAIPLEVVYMWYYHMLCDEPLHKLVPLPKWQISTFARYVDDDYFYVPPPEAQARFEEVVLLPFVHNLGRLDWYCFSCSAPLGRWPVEWFHHDLVVSTSCVCRVGEGPLQDEILRRWIAAVAHRREWNGERVPMMLKVYMTYLVTHKNLLFDLFHADAPVNDVLKQHLSRWNRPIKSQGYRRMLIGRVTDMALAAAPPIQGSIPLSTRFLVYNLCDGIDADFRGLLGDIWREVDWTDNIYDEVVITDVIHAVEGGVVEHQLTPQQRLVQYTVTMAKATSVSQGLQSHMGKALDRVKPSSSSGY